MKKKTLMSEEALKLMLGTAKPEADGGTPAVVPDTEQKVEKKAEAKADEEKTPPEAEGTEDVREPDLAAELQELTAEFEAAEVEHKAKIEELELARVQEAEAHAAEIVEIQASIVELQEIIVDQISQMRVGLGLPTVDMADETPKAVVKIYHSTSKKFIAAMPVGGIVPDADEKVVPKMTSLDVSGIKSLGF